MRFFASAFAVAVLAAQPAFAAPVSAIAQVDFSGVVTINTGTAVPGVDITDSLVSPMP